MSVFSFMYLLLASTVLGWGDVGHRTVGYLAQHYLTAEASQWVNSLLEDEDGFDISDAAVWPDYIKPNRTYTAGWHYLDANDSPPGLCAVDYNRDCPSIGGCAVSAIINQTSLVLDNSQNPTVRAEALMYLIHFIGDIHQPLHIENLDRGGNGIPVCFDSRCSPTENLHSIWDTDIIHKINGLNLTINQTEEREAAQKWADSLFASRQHDVETECDDIDDPEDCAMEWARETNAYICSYVLANGVEWLENNDLGGDYYDGAVPIVESQIANAGARLGAWLNALAAIDSSSTRFVIQEEL
ncbi:phospholipase C/P1 nuclease domain-containing protein [Xylogone sp. PMI_703]|nr:phospholipase C/P1 nuclease domain-containing protein [Xylogone sp. PMI_703]